MKSIAQRLQIRREKVALRPRIKTLESEISNALESPVRLTVIRPKFGYDSILHAKSRGKRVAVVRIINPERVRPQKLSTNPIRCSLNPSERLEREWSAYSALFHTQLSPEPVWRTHDAVACRWVSGKRMSAVLRHQRRKFWELAELSFAAIDQMHAQGIRHFDLHTGNFIYHAKSNRVSIIDFEYECGDQLNDVQARAWDFLYLTNDLIRPRRGGSELLKSPDRFVEMLCNHLPSGSNNADWMSTSLPLRYLTDSDSLWQKILHTVKNKAG